MMETGTHVCVDCTGDALFAQAEEIHDRLCTALRDGRPIVIDCRGVDGADVSFIQLLLAVRVSALQRGIPFAIGQSPGAAVLTVLERGGFLSPVCVPNADFWTAGV